LNRTEGHVDKFIQDLRYGLRALVARPAFTLIAVLALALGIGANSAIFSIVHTILMQPLPYRAPERLVMLWHTYPQLNLPQATLSVPSYLEYRDNAGVFESVAARQGWSVNLTGAGEPERVQGARVTANFLKTLGVQVARGRDFLAEEDRPGSERVVLLTDGLWRRRFGADPATVGSLVSLNGEAHTVIGILPPGFSFFQLTDLLKPIAFTPEQMNPTNHGFEFLTGVARLREGMTPAQARAGLDTLQARLRTEFYDQGWGVVMTPLLEQIAGDVRPMLYILLAAVGCLLLIACANVANLLLARGTSRQKEIAVRAALGAGRGRIVRQLLTESVLLSVAGGAAGLFVGFWGLRALLAAVPRGQLQTVLVGREIGLNGTVLLFTLAISVATGVLFGLAPALAAARPDLSGVLKEGGREAAGGRHRMLGVFVVSQVATAMVLLIGAGLLIRSMERLRAVDPGFRPEGLLTMRVFLPQARYAEPAQINGFLDSVLERLAALPGAQSATHISSLPLSGDNTSGSFAIENRPAPEGNPSPHGDSHCVSAAYFETMGIPLVKGRLFDARDSASGTPAIIVDQFLADRLFPGEDPVGHRLSIFGEGTAENAVWRTIVGVVGHVAKHGLDGRVKEQYYVPAAQGPQRQPFLIVRTAGDPGALAPAARAAVAAVDPDMPVFRLMTMQQVIDDTLIGRRFTALLLGIFAVVALVLAAVGLYGVIAYAVSQRTHEIGVRMALGARVEDVVHMVVRQGMRLAVIGLVVGAAAALATTRFLASLLFGVGAADPVTFVAIPAILALVALVASWLPARRAARVDPMVALRGE
jgi:putative ABC transport system permease protein